MLPFTAAFAIATLRPFSTWAATASEWAARCRCFTALHIVGIRARAAASQQLIRRLFLVVWLAACQTPHQGTIPHAATIDEAAMACLDWAWEWRPQREVAGGVVVGEDGSLTCSRLTVGTRWSVEVEPTPYWLVEFHTHTDRSEISALDEGAVRETGRPVYVRIHNQRIVVYECEGDDCMLRRVR